MWINENDQRIKDDSVTTHNALRAGLLCPADQDHERLQQTERRPDGTENMAVNTSPGTASPEQTEHRADQPTSD